ncbi:hypothetical protein VTL71DRAFT_9771 [Oculimacula yallundae]|uniref:Uncharacterized protein n=1 Tax=Oculimacula yallundae TaxID=86028 RepID=A0ABR4BTE8_9HELO
MKEFSILTTSSLDIIEKMYDPTVVSVLYEESQKFNSAIKDIQFSNVSTSTSRGNLKKKFEMTASLRVSPGDGIDAVGTGYESIKMSTYGASTRLCKQELAEWMLKLVRERESEWEEHQLETMEGYMARREREEKEKEQEKEEKLVATVEDRADEKSSQSGAPDRVEEAPLSASEKMLRQVKLNLTVRSEAKPLASSIAPRVEKATLSVSEKMLKELRYRVDNGLDLHDITARMKEHWDGSLL